MFIFPGNPPHSLSFVKYDTSRLERIWKLTYGEKMRSLGWTENNSWIIKMHGCITTQHSYWHAALVSLGLLDIILFTTEKTAHNPNLKVNHLLKLRHFFLRMAKGRQLFSLTLQIARDYFSKPKPESFIPVPNYPVDFEASEKYSSFFVYKVYSLYTKSIPVVDQNLWSSIETKFQKTTESDFISSHI